jgi:ABC-type sugar transport system ATPase subunit
MVIADKAAVMNHGKLVQYDTPDKLYDKPKNLFVAGFVGSPPINFIDCTLVGKNGKILLNAGDFTYDVTFFEKTLANRTDSEAILGIRPEHITMRKDKFDRESIQGEIYVVEPARPELIVHVTVGKTTLVLVTSVKERYAIGDKVWVKFQEANLHLFDKRTGEAIV